MATRRRRSEANLRPGTGSAGPGLERTASQLAQRAASTGQRAAVLDNTGRTLFGVAAEKRQREAEAAANAVSLEREAVLHEITVDGQKRVIRDSNAAVPPKLPDAGSISIFDQRYRAAMQSRFLADTETTARQTLSKLAADYQDRPDLFAAAAQQYVEQVAASSGEENAGVVGDAVRRVAQGLEAGLLSQKAARDYVRANQSWKDNLTNLTSDLVRAFAGGATGNLLVRTPDGRTALAPDSQLTGTMAQIIQQLNKGVEAGWLTEPKREAFIKDLGDRLATSQITSRVVATGDDEAGLAERSRIITDLASGKLEMSVPTIGADGTVSFSKMPASKALPPETRAKLASDLRTYSALMDERRTTTKALTADFENTQLAVLGAMITRNQMAGIPLDFDKIQKIGESLSTPAAQVRMAMMLASAFESDSKAMSEAFGTDVDRKVLNRLVDAAGGWESLARSGDPALEVLADSGTIPSEQIPTAIQAIQAHLSRLSALDKARAKAAAARDAWMQRNDNAAEGNVISRWKPTDMMMSDEAAAMGFAMLGFIDSPDDMSPSLWLEQPQQGVAMLRQLQAAPPRSLLEAMTSTVTRFANGEDVPVDMETVAGYFRAMRELPGYANFLRGENALPRRVYDVLQKLVGDADTRGTLIGGPEAQKLVSNYFTGNDAQGGKAWYENLDVESQRQIQEKIVATLSDGPFFGRTIVPSGLVSSVLDEAIRVLPLYNFDIDDAVKAVTDPSTSDALSRGLWGKSRFTWNGGAPFQAARNSGLTGGVTDAWVQKAPTRVYAGLGIDDEQFMQWADEVLRKGADPDLESQLELGRNTFIKPSTTGDREYSFVYIDGTGTLRQVTDSRGMPVTVNFDPFVEDHRKTSEQGLRAKLEEERKKAVFNFETPADVQFGPSP